MSTDTQLKGDSRRRQLEKSRAYAERHNLELVDDDELEDIGVSAFKGANVKQGALGRFLAAVNDGRIPPGSSLLVESLDRLSRQQVLPAMSLFLSIVQAGIILVTLDDERVYKKEATDVIDLIVSLTVLSRAHEESKTKSLRVAAAWKNKRSQAPNRPMTKICPAWLRLSEDRSGYEIVEDRAALVRSIFQDAANGIGIYSIARRLNEQKTPTFNDSDGWHASYIAKILNNRATLGEFQPHTKVDGIRKPDGDPIPGYFPTVVEPEIFYRAKTGRAERLQHSRGRKGQNVTNLFSGLTECSNCRSSMKFENKGSGQKGGRYFVCDKAHRHMGCINVRWKYENFERSFLTFVKELELASLVNGSSKDDEVHKAEAEIAILEGKITETRELMEKTFHLMQAGEAVDFVSRKLAEQQTTLNELQRELHSKQVEKEANSGRREAFEESKAEIKSLVEQVHGKEGDAYKLRAMVSSKLKSLVDFVVVAPAGRVPTIQKVIDELSIQKAGDWESVVSHMRASLNEPSNSRPYFVVAFRDGSMRAVTPNRRVSHGDATWARDDFGATTAIGLCRTIDPPVFVASRESPRSGQSDSEPKRIL
jgi:DNA invertase Pin-like site-specific DNA recombinase